MAYTGIFYAFRCEGKTKNGDPVTFEVDASLLEGRPFSEVFAVLNSQRDFWEEMEGCAVEWGDFRFVMTDASGVLG